MRSKASRKRFAHSVVTATVKPGVVGDEADDALAAHFGDPPFGHAEEADVKIVEPLTLGGGPSLVVRYAVVSDRVFFHRHAGEAVVGRIAQDDEYLLVPLDVVGGVAFSCNSGNRRFLGSFGGSQPVKRIGQIDADALALLLSTSGEPSACSSRPNCRCDTTNGAGRISKPKTRFMAACLQVLTRPGRRRLGLRNVSRDLAQHFHQIRPRAATGVKHDDVRVGQAVG